MPKWSIVMLAAGGVLFAAALVLPLAGALLFAEETPGGAAWVNLSDAVVAKITADGKKVGAYGPTSGVAVDAATGDVFMVVNDLGLFKSSDKGKTFENVADGKTVGGRGETAFALQADPAGKRLACFMVYGTSAATPDGGKTWTVFKVNHFDFGAVDWTDAKTMVALRHESGGMLTVTADGGTTWKDLGKGFKGVGVFDAKTFVATKEKEDGIFRSTDAGATWTKVSDLKPAGFVMQTYKGVGYWTSDAGLLVSKDKGKQWQVQGAAMKGFEGPFFGKDESQIVVVNGGGFQESADGGRTWKLAAPLPAGWAADRMTLCAWDAGANIFYVSRMTKPTMKLERQGTK
jgi:hypothetical protein